MAIGMQVEIHIRAQQEGRYPVEITLTDAKGGCRHFDGHLVARPWVPTASPDDNGQRLFGWLFADPALKTAWDRVSEHRPHRLRLRIDASAPELHAIPWELMQEPFADRLPRHLAGDTDTPFSRYPAVNWPPQQPLADRPIRILVAIAAPEDLGEYNLASLDVEMEQGIIADAFQDLTTGQAQLSFLEPPVTLSRLEADLKQGCDLLHLVAHGRYSAKLGKGILYLADGDGHVAPESDRDLAAMIDRLSQGQRPGLVFLASCQGATRDTTDSFRGLAPALIEAGVPAVLAMQDAVEVNTARAFTRAFYRQMFAHGQVDLACNEARSALLTGGFPGSSIPVLFSRLADNQLLASLPGAVIDIKPFEPETVYVPAGWFLIGSLPGEGIPEHEQGQEPIHLPAYRIGRYPVTNREYAEFIKRMRRQPVPTKAWLRRQPPANLLDHPLVAVTWEDALAYCRWLSGVTKRIYRLPTEAEWEKAARGREGQPYPWGDEWAAGYSPEMARITPVTTGGDVRKKGTTPFQPQAASPYGCYDMVGNVQEWTSTLWGSSQEESDYPYPYDPEDGREDPGTPSRFYRICRGGPALGEGQEIRCSSRARARADSATWTRGFRVVLEV